MLQINYYHMKIKIGILMLLTGVIIFSSCNNNRTYADMKKAQKKAINKFTTEKGIEIIYTWPTDSIFEEDQFVLLDNGVYLNIVDAGNGNKAIQGKTKISMRCSGERFFESDTVAFNLFTNINTPIEFTYGYASNTMSLYSEYIYYQSYHPYAYYLSTGVESILEYVGENAIVKLIVPFEVGSLYQSSSGSYGYGSPIYYDKVKFQFYQY